MICYSLPRKPVTLVDSFGKSEAKMVEKLRPDELASFREAFDTFDKNSDGTISTKVALIEVVASFTILNIEGTACGYEKSRTKSNRVRSSRYD